MKGSGGRSIDVVMLINRTISLDIEKNEQFQPCYARCVGVGYGPCESGEEIAELMEGGVVR